MQQPPKPATLRSAIANSIAVNLKAYDVAGFCNHLGLAPPAEGEDPFKSKFVYVSRRLQELTMPGLIDIGRRVLEEWDDEELQRLVDAVPPGGVAGEMKNVIFASDGPKPQIVLRDALNNDLEIVQHADRCLIYDQPLMEHGLTWAEMVAWWAPHLHTENLDVAARHLWMRLSASLVSDAERLLFKVYTARYGREGFGVPALIPQVYLHYDPYAQRAPGYRPTLARQRMDFLLLLPRRARVVVEVDGRHHYADDHGAADPARYARMVAEDRRLRLAGYEIYRFGGYELMTHDAEATVDAFFDVLLALHPA